MKHLNTLLILTATFVLTSANAAEVLRSPNEAIEVSFTTDADQITYMVSLNGETIISPSELGLKSDANAPLEVVNIQRSSVDETWETVWGNYSEIRNHYNEIQLELGKVAAQTVIFRVYDDGIAFRYEDSSSKHV